MEQENDVSIDEAQFLYIDRLRSIGKSKQTVKAYRQGIKKYITVLEDNGVDLQGSLEQLTVESYDLFIRSLEELEYSTRNLYTTAVTNFIEYLVAMDYTEIELIKIQMLKKTAKRKVSTEIPHFSKENIQKIVDYAHNLNTKQCENFEERLRNYRDRALIITLADTGLRIHEACNLLRKSIDFNEGKAIITGKGNKQAVIRFTKRSLQSIRDYLNLRASLDGNLGKPLNSLPVFMRHDRPVGKKNISFQHLSMSTKTGREIVKLRVEECLGPEEVGNITPHSFRHYFVTVVLNASGNMRITQELARHSNISTTSRYAHLANDELDKAFLDALET